MKKTGHVIFIYEGEDYRIAKISCRDMEPLAVLVAHDIRLRIDDFFTKWLQNSEKIGVQANSTIVDLEKDGTIEIRDLLDEGDIDDPVFRMPKEEYRKMVEDWQKLVKQKPKEIIVSWDGKEITVEGRG